MANGFPIAHHAFPGNTAGKSTLQEVMTDLQEGFGLGHIMVVSVGGRDARRIAAALRLRDLTPPTPENTASERSKTQI